VRSRWNFLIVLIYAGIASTILAFMAANMAGPCQLGAMHVPGFQQCMTLNVEFKNASGLLHSNDLRVAGVKAGQVTSVDVKKKVALITIQVEPKFQPVYRNTHAVVRPKNLLGETYVEIDRGTPEAGKFHEGETVSLVNTLTPVQVDEVLNALDPDTRTKLGIVINALGAATAQRGNDLNLSAGDFRRIAADVAVTSTSLDQEKSNLDALITQLDLMQKTVADYHDQLAQVLQKWNDSSTTMMKHDVGRRLRHRAHPQRPGTEGRGGQAALRGQRHQRLPRHLGPDHRLLLAEARGRDLPAAGRCRALPPAGPGDVGREPLRHPHLCQRLPERPRHNGECSMPGRGRVAAG
jgi:ABC-type transporter Mla subunit MlaD